MYYHLLTLTIFLFYSVYSKYIYGSNAIAFAWNAFDSWTKWEGNSFYSYKKDILDFGMRDNATFEGRYKSYCYIYDKFRKMNAIFFLMGSLQGIHNHFRIKGALNYVFK